MKSIVFDPRGILVPTSCANLPISFIFMMFHLLPSLPFKSAGSYNMCPVVGSMAAPAKQGLITAVILLCAAAAYAYLAFFCGWSVVVRLADGCTVCGTIRDGGT